MSVAALGCTSSSVLKGTKCLHTTAALCTKWRYKMMDGAPIMPKRKRAEIRLMRPNKEACQRFWWKEDDTIWHWPRDDAGYFRYGRYQPLKGKPVQVTDPEKVEMVKKLMGPYHLYRQTEWFRHDHEYERDPYENLSRGFLGLPSKGGS
ncbi:uncharacterized protein LOC134826057 [Bolinopsis microptera]|uniref:uncharacterized protein LOC134826057 n=1 Tax=Bolinopsis microptera TaxID=2820187 RepID=UPI003078B496